MEKSLAASLLHSILPSSGSEGVYVSEGNDTSPSLTHPLATLRTSNSVSEMCVLDAGGTEAKRLDGEPPVWLGEEESIFSLRVKKMHIHVTAKQGRTWCV